MVGREFEGRNLHPLARPLGLERFRKGFFRGPSDGRVYGYNRLPSARGPGRLAAAALRGRPFLFFAVVHATERAAPAHRDALVIRYGGWPGRGRLDPLRLVVDYLVSPARPDADAGVLLGRSYLELPGRRVFLERFVLERISDAVARRPADIRPPIRT